ncbi:MAG TPA: class I SAM-dependent methyltransferase [Casimicrobiaceae bacterium]|nr:class I SAM-dependent methyltransferase [Casimicrobiaceae bacterium]
MSAAPPEHTSATPPLPPPEANAHCARVIARLAHEIAEEDGWISFAQYMEQVMYAPGLGYYAAGWQKFGGAGDFVTAPELTPLFGRTVARQLAQVLKLVPDGEILELGPGSGRLAGDIMKAMAEHGAPPSPYCLLEVSAELRERQRAHLTKAAPEAVARIEWIDILPERWSGVVFANEVLDSVPPHLVLRRDGEWYERGVTLASGGRLVFADRLLGRGALRDAAQARFPPEVDYLSEFNPAAEALLRTFAQRCERGAMLFVDYGFPAAEYYHPQRSAGTLMAHYRHRAIDDPFFLPGLADLTAHVDFSAMARAGVAGGMQLAGYTTQARFLVNCGLLQELERCGDPQSFDYLREAGAVQKLTSPAEMGELFKVLALVRGIEPDLIGFRDGDQSHRL